MVRLLTVLVLTLLTFSSLNAQPFELIFTERQGGVENYACFDPLLDESHQFAGFIYCDTARRQVIVDDFKADSAITIDVDGVPVKTIHYYYQERETLVIYVLINDGLEMPRIGLLAVSSEGVSKTSVTANCFTAPGSLTGILRQDLIFERDARGEVTGVWFETALEFEDYGAGMGGTFEVVSTSILYGLDLKSEMLRDNVTGIRAGNLTGDETTELVTFNNYLYSYRLSDMGFGPEEGRVSWTSYGVRDAVERSLANQVTDDGHTHDVFVADFEPGIPFDEVIYYGDAYDLTDDHIDAASHLACYTVVEESPRQLWYLEIGGIEFDHIYTDQNLLIGHSDSGEIVFVDCRRGEIVDTVLLGRNLTEINFFETYDDPTTLNLVGRSHDTVFVYRFDISITVESFAGSEQEQEVPTSFTLHQNHPNPFNGETRLSFDNEESQFLSLKVYNILGQEVATLMEGVYSPGTYYAYWSGEDDRGISQSSGVYFAKLQGGPESQIIKLIYLK